MFEVMPPHNANNSSALKPAAIKMAGVAAACAAPLVMAALAPTAQTEQQRSKYLGHVLTHK
jgi:hypothetical protein